MNIVMCMYDVNTVSVARDEWLDYSGEGRVARGEEKLQDAGLQDTSLYPALRASQRLFKSASADLVPIKAFGDDGK